MLNKKILCLVPVYNLLNGSNSGGKVVLTLDVLKVLSNYYNLFLLDWKNNIDDSISKIDSIPNAVILGSGYKNLLNEYFLFKLFYFLFNFRFKYTFFRIFNSVQLCGEYVMLLKYIRQINPTHIYSCYTNSTYQLLIPLIRKEFPELKLINHFHHGFQQNHSLLHKLILVNPNSINFNSRNSEVISPYISSSFINNSNYLKDNSIVFVAKLWERKNCELLIKSFLNLNLSFFRLNIVGDGPLLEYLRNKYKFDNVVFYGDVSEDVKLTLLSKANLFVLPSLNEGFGISYLESLAVGTPIIAYFNSFNLFKYYFKDLEFGEAYFPDSDDFHTLGIKIRNNIISNKFNYKQISDCTHQSFNFNIFSNKLIKVFSE